MATFTCKAWSNGQPSATGSGLDLSVSHADRDRFFKPHWTTVTIELPRKETSNAVQVNVGKPSFWHKCPELISKEIGIWLMEEGFAPWPPGKPPRFNLVQSAEASFRVERP